MPFVGSFNLLFKKKTCAVTISDLYPNETDKTITTSKGLASSE